MDEYIKREDAIDAVLDVYCDTPDIDLSCEKFEAAILKIPAADVAEVQHERWEKRGSKWQCTGCKGLMSIDGTPQENLLYYCPNCGAKMDKEEVCKENTKNI